MSDIHEYNKICAKFRQEATKWADTNDRVCYAIDWYIADRIEEAKKFISRQTDYCCEENYRLLQLAFNSLRLLVLLAVIPVPFFDEVYEFFNNELAEDLRRKRESHNQS